MRKNKVTGWIYECEFKKAIFYFDKEKEYLISELPLIKTKKRLLENHVCYYCGDNCKPVKVEIEVKLKEK